MGMPQAGLLDQTIGTGLLLLLILAITDEWNTPPGANLAPLMIGLVVVAIGMSFGGMHGYAINPARDFGPRLFTVVAGFRNNGITDGTQVWWVPIVGPLLGGLLGSALYEFAIRPFLKPLVLTGGIPCHTFWLLIRAPPVRARLFLTSRARSWPSRSASLSRFFRRRDGWSTIRKKSGVRRSASLWKP